MAASSTWSLCSAYSSEWDRIDAAYGTDDHVLVSSTTVQRHSPHADGRVSHQHADVISEPPAPQDHEQFAAPPPSAAPSVAGDELCTVCCCPIDADADALGLRSCFHVFHAECLDRWLRRSASCPNCRLEVRAGSVVKRAPLSAASLALLCGEQPQARVADDESDRRSAAASERSRFSYTTARGWPRIPSFGWTCMPGMPNGSPTFAQVAARDVAAPPPASTRDALGERKPKERGWAMQRVKLRAQTPRHSVVVVGGRLLLSRARAIGVGPDMCAIADDEEEVGWDE